MKLARQTGDDLVRHRRQCRGSGSTHVVVTIAQTDESGVDDLLEWHFGI